MLPPFLGMSFLLLYPKQCSIINSFLVSVTRSSETQSHKRHFVKLNVVLGPLRAQTGAYFKSGFSSDGDLV